MFSKNRLDEIEKQLASLKNKIDNITVPESGKIEKQLDDLRDEVHHLKIGFDDYQKNMNIRIWHMNASNDKLFARLELERADLYTGGGNTNRLLQLKDSHRGEKCFIIGNGPSLTTEDLDILCRNNVTCFACNKIALIYNYTQWRPDYYFCSDPMYYDFKSIDEQEQDLTLRLFPVDVIDGLSKKDTASCFYPLIRRYMLTPEFGYNICGGVYEGGSVVYQEIQMAVYMGFTEIYLLGVDNSFHYKELPDGRLGIDLSVQSHFYAEDSESKEVEEQLNGWVDYGNPISAGLYLPDDGYRAAKWHCDNKGIKILNATRGGKLEIFPRVNFDEYFG